MHFSAFFAVACYILILILIGVLSKKKNQTSSDFMIGSRKMSFWLTAFAAHASDMSSWIFMAYPAVIYTIGLFNVWTAIGLTIFMFINWQFVAKKLRLATECYNSLTLPSFFESRFADTSGLLRIFTVLISFGFYTIYISSGLVALGILLETLFGLPYIIGMTIGVFIIVPYLFIGGYITLAWTDLFQGIFLLLAIVFVPFYALIHIGGFPALSLAIAQKTEYMGILPDTSWKTILTIIFTMCSWGLGYFGQPHIVTKFMGIKNPEEIHKAKWVGISWQIVSLTAATLMGLIGIAFFAKTGPLIDSQLVFINMALALFPAFLSAFILCAILGATITVMDSQILVLSSNLTEDFYKKILRKGASSKELLIVSRISVLIVALIAYLIACQTKSTIYTLVSYAWYGLGASFGPVVLFGLYSKKANRIGAWAGLISGSLIAAIWPLINKTMPLDVPTLIPGFLISSFTIWAVSSITQYKNGKDVIGINE
jgi:sodium/proline symporter